LYEGRASLEVGVDFKKIKTGISGYLHGVSPSFESLHEYYNGAGMAFYFMGDVGPLWIGTLGTFEKDRQTGNDILQAGVILDWDKHNIILGPTYTYNIHPNFRDAQQGWMIHTSHEFGKWNISASYTQGHEKQGSLHIGWKK